MNTFFDLEIAPFTRYKHPAMPSGHSMPLPEPGTLRAGEPPWLMGRMRTTPITIDFLIATVVLASAGVVLFGWNSLRVIAICVAAVLALEPAARAVDRRKRGGALFALFVGMLTAATCPAHVYWAVPLCAAAVAALAIHVSGGPGNYIWHPVALGRVAVELLFPEQMNPPRWPVLAPGRLVWGDLSASRELPPLWSWDQPLPEGVQAWLVPRSADVLRQPIPASADGAAGAIAALVRDSLPPWWNTLLGVGGGAIGEACLLGVITAGLFLAWRGWLKWPLPTCGVAAAAVTAAILPLSIRSPGGGQELYWFPASALSGGLPVGLVYVLYAATAGELPLVLTLLGSDSTSSPLTARGHAVFGALIGATAVTLRIGAGVSAAGYWALLIANACVPLIDRATRRRVFGT